MAFPNTRFHSDDWVYVRYAYRTKDGRLVSPLRVEQQEREVARGYQCFGWIEQHPGAKAVVHGRGLDDKAMTLPLAELDLSRPTEAYAYTSEKVFYLRSNLTENFPVAGFDIIRSRLENAPDVTPEFMSEYKDTLEAQGVDKMWDLYQKAADKPETLVEEFELFRMMFRSTKAYDVNTVLQKDPKVTSKMEAVGRTMKLIANLHDSKDERLRATISDYGRRIE